MAELKWLEDLVALMDAESLTDAARQRHVTQPAFSRRIRLLEHWLGVELLDRARKPVQIKSLLRDQEQNVRDLVRQFYQLRNQLQDSTRHERIVFIVQHTLAVSHFPALLQSMQHEVEHGAYRVQTANNEDCPILFQQNAHYMLCYEHKDQPLISAGGGIIQRRVLGEERFVPVVADAVYNTWEQRLALGTENPPLPVLLFPEDSFFARALGKSLIPQIMRAYSLNVVCESALAISLKQMALAGMGVAWLPESLVKGELDSGDLQQLESLGECSLDICFYEWGG